jgi:hypothetical protein
MSAVSFHRYGSFGKKLLYILIYTASCHRTSSRGLASRNDRFPFNPAVGTLDGVVGVEEACITRARIGFGDGQFIVNVGMAMAEAASANRTRPSCFLLTKPALHGAFLLFVYSLI